MNAFQRFVAASSASLMLGGCSPTPHIEIDGPESDPQSVTISILSDRTIQCVNKNLTATDHGFGFGFQIPQKLVSVSLPDCTLQSIRNKLIQLGHKNLANMVPDTNN